jgi:hypothetical protein
MRNPGLALAYSRRDLLRRIGGGFGAVGLAGVLAEDLARPTQTFAREASANPLAPKPPHYSPRATRVIFLFMNGGPSHVDTFDPKPMLAKLDGQGLPESVDTGRKGRGKLMGSPFSFAKYGESGIEVSSLFPEVSKCIDDVCVIRSMQTDVPNHEPAL